MKFIFLVFALIVMFASAAVCAPAVPFLPKGVEATNVQYSSGDSGAYLYYTDKEGSERYLELAGEKWDYVIATDDVDKVASELEALLKEKNAELFGSRGDVTAFRIKESEQSLLSVSIRKRSDELGVFALRERFINPGQTLAFTCNAGNEQETWWFKAKLDGTKFGTFEVHFEGESIDFEAYRKEKMGLLERSVPFRVTMDGAHGANHLCYSFPQLAGDMPFKIEHRYCEKPCQVRVKYVTSVPIAQVPQGDALGGLLVDGASWGSASVKSEYEESIDHPSFADYSKTADRTPTGQALFWLPPGQWTVEMKPKEPDVQVVRAHMIPVHPGRITRVRIPASLTPAFAAPTAGRLEMLRVSGTESLGQMDVAIVDTQAAGMEATTTNTSVFEGGEKCKIRTLTRLEVPLDIVLLLDSSGSMKGSMRQALAAVRSFIAKLPANGRIRVVDFDTTPKELPGATREELLKSLNGVIARGATCLYDSIIRGLDMLQDSKRPGLIVFTDGVDANWNDTKPGSKSTKPQVLARAKEVAVPIFTIGFGKKPDVDTLQRVAAIGGGAYYGASDQKALDDVFARISSNLGNQYRLTYERPKSGAVSDAPVISMVVDNSGSMDTSPDSDGCDYRIERVRQILHHFVHSMPQGFSGQVLTFTDDVEMAQVLTDDRAKLLRALSLMEGNGGTGILSSVQASLKTLATVPSNRRYLVYITDAALAVSETEQALFDTLLGKLADRGIACLWVGICEKDEDGVFAHAAKLSGGKAVVSTKLDVIAKALADLSQRIGKVEESDGKTALRVQMSHRLTNGEVIALAAQQRHKLPARKAGGVPRVPEGLEVEIRGKLKPYEGDISKFISGTDTLVREVRIQKRIKLDVEGKNKATNLSIKEAIFLTRLKGLEPPGGKRFLALQAEIVNILPKQKVAVYPNGSNHPAAWVAAKKPLRYEERVPDYVIPDLARHVFLRLNNKISLPTSEVTWIMEAPLSLPNEPGVNISAGKPVKGTLAFVVPQENIHQMSLHLYDTNYGHIDLPLIGTMEYSRKVYEKLPKEEPQKLTDAFSMALRAYRDEPTIAQIPAGEGFTFRIVELGLRSNVQAHISVEPAKRFTLRIHTHRGSLVLPLHPVTSKLPLGFYGPSFVTPGSSNTMRLAFRIPAVLAKSKNKGILAVDIYGGGLELPLTKGGTLPSRPEKATDILPKHIVAGKGLAIQIHECGLGRDDMLCVEASIADDKDGEHTALGEMIILKRKDFGKLPKGFKERERQRQRLVAAVEKPVGLGSFASSLESDEAPYGPDVLVPLAAKERYLFGLDDRSVVADGTCRRGVLFFQIPDGCAPADYEVSSLIFDKLKIGLTEEGEYKNKVLQARTMERYIYDSSDDSFSKRLAKVVGRLNRERNAKNIKKPGTIKGTHADFSDKAVGVHIDCPSWPLVAKEKSDSINTIEKLRAELSKLDYIPFDDSPWAHRYAEEAVWTQGWYMHNEAAVMAEKRLVQQGIMTERTTVEVTEEGIEALSKLADGLECTSYNLPALRYKDDRGREHIIVSPFLKEVGQLKGLVKYKENKEVCTQEPRRISFYVELGLVPRTQGKHANTADASSALAGESSEEEPENKTVIVCDINLADLSLDVLDLGYSITPTMEGDKLFTVLDGPMGRIVGEEPINLANHRVVGEHITIGCSHKSFTVKSLLDKEECISTRFHTIAINTPDLPKSVVEEVEAARKKAHDVAINPDGLSALQWFTRGVITRFVAAQCKNEKKLSKALGVKVARRSKERLLMVNLKRKDGKLVSTMDILHPFAEIIAGDEEAIKAFNIQAGVFDARLEGKALPGGVTVFDIWKMTPKGTKLLPFQYENRDALVEQLRKLKASPAMIEALENTNDVLFFPMRPAIINGKAKWAWLQVNPDSYETSSHFDTGEHGAMSEHIIGGLVQDFLSYLVGAWKGVESSVWAVAAFSLILDDYDEIIKAAEKFINGTSNSFGVTKGKAVQVGCDVGGNPAITVGPIKIELTPGGLMPNQNLLGWGNGYKAGVAYYFDKAK